YPLPSQSQHSRNGHAAAPATIFCRVVGVFDTHTGNQYPFAVFSGCCLWRIKIKTVIEFMEFPVIHHECTTVKTADDIARLTGIPIAVAVFVHYMREKWKYILALNCEEVGMCPYDTVLIKFSAEFAAVLEAARITGVIIHRPAVVRSSLPTGKHLKSTVLSPYFAAPEIVSEPLRSSFFNP